MSTTGDFRPRASERVTSASPLLRLSGISSLSLRWSPFVRRLGDPLFPLFPRSMCSNPPLGTKMAGQKVRWSVGPAMDGCMNNLVASSAFPARQPRAVRVHLLFSRAVLSFCPPCPDPGRLLSLGLPELPGS